MIHTFAELFQMATGDSEQPRLPYRFQHRFAEADVLHDVVRAPTGSGKTATAILGWLWRRRFAREEIRKATPRRLVYCLPMRTLVEQTVRCAQAWLNNLGVDNIHVHKLLGGDTDNDWALHPERDAILVGTQDMLLSRALNRGYAQGRFRWPIDFGLLNNDCLWVFDELQLMGPGVSTSAQLAGLREKLATFGPCCRSVWMSATLERSWLETVDFRERVGQLHELTLDNDEFTTGELGRRMQAIKILHPLGVQEKALAGEVKHRHQAGTLTLVVLNTVDRACAIYAELTKAKAGVKAEVLLIHSRFRPVEREILNRKLAEKKDRIVVATQVVEAGVDISARVLFTELAPWASLVQRFGRCHRYGEFNEPGEVFWLDVEDKKALPYEAADLNIARAHLQALTGQDVSPLALQNYSRDNNISFPSEHRHVLRRRDLLDLFDTAPDLSGNDIDIARFVRGDDPDTDVSVFWREFKGKAALAEQQQPRRDELCSVPIGKMREFLKKNPELVAYRKDHFDDEWVRVKESEVRPGMVLLLPCATGGYDWDEKKESGRGWCGEVAAKPRVITGWLQLPCESEEAVAADEWSCRDPQTLVDHTQDVCTELEDILASLDLPGDHKAELHHAARWHDLGKAHTEFQASVQRANDQLDKTKIWAKSGRGGRLRHKRKHFRHELASALAMLGLGHSFLAIYLVAAHHGRVRLAIRSLPNETPPAGRNQLFALGIHEGDTLPEIDLGGTNSPVVKLSLASMRLGDGSWTRQALALLTGFGPFKLAYLEALLRAADMRASANPKTGAKNA